MKNIKKKAVEEIVEKKTKVLKKDFESSDSKTDIVVFKKEVNPIVELATSVRIKDDKTMKSATEMLSRLNQLSDKVTEHKERKTVPLNAALKEIRSDYKPLEDALKVGIGHIREQMSVYQTEQKRLEDEEAARIAARVGEGKGKLKMDTAIKKIDEIDHVEDKVVADSGVVKFRTDKRLKIVDSTLVPRDYLVIDEKKVLEALKAGKEVAGCAIEEVQVPINFR